MLLPDKEKIEKLLKAKGAPYWTTKDQLEVYQQLKNLYEHWFRIEIK